MRGEEYVATAWGVAGGAAGAGVWEGGLQVRDPGLAGGAAESRVRANPAAGGALGGAVRGEPGGGVPDAADAGGHGLRGGEPGGGTEGVRDHGRGATVSGRARGAGGGHSRADARLARWGARRGSAPPAAGA